MDRIPVTSSNVVSVGYDPSGMILEVEFKNAAIYQYYDVPEAVYMALMQSDSIGKFLNSNIKSQYRYSRM